jgi:hypothetical protein
MLRAFAATIRGGLTPKEIFGDSLKLWIDATDQSTVTTSGANDVEGIDDKSGNGNDFVYSGAGFNKAKYETDNNGNKYINIGGVDSLKITNISDFRTTEGEFIIYATGVNTSENRFIALSNESTNNFILFDTNNEKYRIVDRVAGNQNLATVANTLLPNKNKPISYVSDGSNYKILEDLDELIPLIGTNDGDWIGDNSNLETLFIGSFKFNNAIVNNQRFYAYQIFYIDRPATAQEREQLNNSINN